MIDKLLEYQKLDIELRKMKREVNGNMSSKDVDFLNINIKDAQGKILELEENSKELLESFKKLVEVQKKGLLYVQKNKDANIENMTEVELKDFEAKMNQTAKNLAELENRLLSHNQTVKKVVSDYKMYRKQILDAKEAKENLKNQSASVMEEKFPSIEELKKQQKKLESEIDAKKFAKYKALKADGIFPVFVPLVDKRCGGCRVELSSAMIDKIKSDGVCECEQCRRIIYFEKD